MGQGRPLTGKNTPETRAAKKKQILELVGEGATVTEAAERVGISRRMILRWRQQDEKFGVAFSEAYDQSTDKLKRMLWELCEDPETPTRDRLLGMFFLIKQRDPSFRDNAKTELSVSPELATSITKLAKLAEQK